jgi:hypothetical protein
MAKRAEMIGRRFDRLVVIALAKPGRAGRHRYWACQCDCGKMTSVSTSNLTSARGTRSCGCLVREVSSEVNLIHGGRNTREYSSWRCMKKRCFLPTDPFYHRYGGRGITICEEWINSFQAFYDAMGPCPDGYTLGRKENDGPYNAENCRWETSQEQADNKCTTRLIVWNDVTRTLAGWGRYLGIGPSTLRYRLVLQRLSIEQAFTEPVRNRGRRVKE